MNWWYRVGIYLRRKNIILYVFNYNYFYLSKLMYIKQNENIGNEKIKFEIISFDGKAAQG